MISDNNYDPENIFVSQRFNPIIPPGLSQSVFKWNQIDEDQILITAQAKCVGVLPIRNEARTVGVALFNRKALATIAIPHLKLPPCGYCNSSREGARWNPDTRQMEVVFNGCLHCCVE